MSGVPWKPEPSTPSDGEPHDPLRVVAASHGRRQTEKVRLPKRARPRHWRRKSDEDLAHHLRALGCTTEQIERHLARGKMPPSPLPRLRRWIPTGGVPVRREGQASQPSILVHRSSRRMERSPDLPLYSGNRHDVLAFRVSRRRAGSAGKRQARDKSPIFSASGWCCAKACGVPKCPITDRSV